ncbi:glycosyltransferase family 2 protein [Streptomyces jeddahensis]|uniref:Putative glycosyltransferase EpsH n=1 Tax=Streptomyces jeddahensis TaxID=1716141 RepID=A0A177HGJ0_9ACTN|nr:glycosyltransferase family 2 protein [Streptomyces jeddahensis]OAH10092.1 putative glycosyltransferase EpsH [Streptomyces jeddahensis]
MTVKVSVVVPVYNPGPYIEDCIASLLRQSLPDDEYEAIFVDDGSTDETPARLDELAARHPHMRVIHQENSGWSGKPRNVGIEAARGEFVMFVDNDDWLGDEALERMYAYGVEHEADVVIGKMAGKGRPVPLELFRVNRPRADVMNAPLIDSLTPHKMFRRSFLDERGLRFPEGRRRLEDHVFVTEAYLTAGSVAVLSDYVCYYHVKREDASNAGFQRIDPVGYFRNLREALDVVEKYTEPGPLRDRLYRRWFRNEMIERMRGGRLLAWPEEYRHEMFREIHKVAVERFGPGVMTGMLPTQQVVGALIKADRYPDIEALARWEKDIRPHAELTGLEWEGGMLRLGFTGEMRVRSQPMTFLHKGEDGLLDIPIEAAGRDAVALQDTDMSARTGKSKIDLVVRERSTAAEFYQPVEFTRQRMDGDGPEKDRFRLVLRATSTIDPQSAAGGAPLARGIWDVFVRVHICGWTKETRLGAVRSEAARAGRRAAFLGAPARLVLPYWTEPHGNLSLDVGQATSRFGYDLVDLGPREMRVDGADLVTRLPVQVTDEIEALLHLSENAGAERTVSVRAVVTGAEGRSGSVLRAGLTDPELTAGDWRLELSLRDEPERRTRLPLVLTVGPGGALSLRRPHEGAAQQPVPPPRTPRPGLLRRAMRKAQRLTAR